MKYLVIAVLILVSSCTKQASSRGELATKQNKGKGHQNEVALTTQSAFTITHNPDGTFSVDYNGLTNQVWMFFRWGDSLQASGNVYPISSQSYYLNPVTTIIPNGSGTYYQAVLYTGDPSNSAGWVASWSNVVQ